VVVNVFLTSATVLLNHFVEGAKPRPTILLESRTKILPQVNWQVLFCCASEVCYIKYYRCYWKTLSIERNPLPAKNQTLRSYRVHISPTK